MPPPKVRLTVPTLMVMEAVARGYDGDVYGLLISELTGLGTGTVYPILERLEEAGWIEGRWEAGQPSGRPRRRFFTLTNLGRTSLDAARSARTAKTGRFPLPWIGGEASG